LATTAQALGDQRARIFRPRTTDLQEQGIMGIITQRALEEVNRPARLGECLHEYHGMDRVAGEAIRGRDEYPFKASQGRVVA